MTGDCQITTALDELRQRMLPALRAVGRAFRLSEFEQDVLLLCAGVELDSSLATACATVQGDPSRGHATFSLALAKLPNAHWSALTPAAPLRHWHLVEVIHTEAPTASPLRIDERILHELAGVPYLDPRLEPFTQPISATPLPNALSGTANRLAAAWPSTPVQLSGRRQGDLLAVAAAAGATLGLRVLRVRPMPANPADRALLARLLEREAMLSGCAYAFDTDDEFAVGLRAPVVLIGREPGDGLSPKPFVITAPPLDTAARRALWAEELGPASAQLDGWLDRVAGQFDLGLACVGTAAAQIRPLLETGADEAGTRLWAACRAQARPALGPLTERIEPRSGWRDLVLPEPQRRTLHEITAHVRHRSRVLGDWGFAGRTSRGLGTAILFAGPSGTGKTLAAEVLAGALDLDLHRIDLSQVVSKYIGETEKNLRAVFDAADDGGAVLLFDEAEALFGKRSEVKDSHDRYANIEVGYLLQRMESYRGLAILTTNMKSALDPAFLRRLRFIVQFPFPDAVQRAQIWRRAFPKRTPVDRLDADRLARLAVPGGAIANIALSAAFFAAQDDQPVRMGHLLAAARAECDKLERPLPEVEVRGWDDDHGR